MDGKIIERDRKICISVNMGAETHIYKTFFEAKPFLATYPQNLGEHVTDATGLHLVWQGASEMFYQVMDGPPEIIKTLALFEKPAPKVEVKPKPIKTAPLEEVSVSKMGKPEPAPPDEPKPEKPQLKTSTRQRRKKRVK